MNEEEMSVPTTDAEFDNALASGLTESFTEEEAPEEVLETTDTETVEDTPDFIETGIEQEAQDDNVLDSVADVAALIEKGDTQNAIKRLNEYGKGIEKLQQKASTAAQDAVRDVQQVFQGAASGDTQAIEVLNQVLASHGTSIERLFAAKTGLDPETLEPYVQENQVKPTKPIVDPELESLKAEFKALKAEREAREWESKHGQAISDYVKAKEGIDLPTSVIAQARQYFPANAKAEDILKAVMRVNPDAYLTAQANRAASPTAPNSALISKGGKSSTKVDPAQLLKDPAAFERYMNSN